MSLDVGYHRENETHLRNVSVNRSRSRNLNRRRYLLCRGQTACSAYLERPCSRFGILDDDLSLIRTNYRIVDRGRIGHSARAGEAHPDEVSGSFSGKRVNRRKDVKEVDARLDGERSRVRRCRSRDLRTEIDVEVLHGRTLLSEHRVVRSVLNVLIWFGAVENLINRRVCVDKTGPDFPFLAAWHFGGGRSKDLANLIRRKRWIGIEHQSDNTGDVRRCHRCAGDLRVERDVCGWKLGVGVKPVRNEIESRTCRYQRGGELALVGFIDAAGARSGDRRSIEVIVWIFVAQSNITAN